MARNDGIDRTFSRNQDLPTLDDVAKVQEHNEREKDSYSNQDIDTTQTYRNIHFKAPTDSYAAMFELIADGVISRIEITLHRQLANPYELKDNGHAGDRLLQLDIGKVARINADLFCQCPAGDIQSFPCGLHIGAEGFKPRTIFNFSHITSPSYILYFVVSLGNDGICRQPTLYNSHFVSNIIRADEL